MRQSPNHFTKTQVALWFANWLLANPWAFFLSKRGVTGDNGFICNTSPTNQPSTCQDYSVMCLWPNQSWKTILFAMHWLTAGSWVWVRGYNSMCVCLAPLGEWNQFLKQTYYWNLIGMNIYIYIITKPFPKNSFTLQYTSQATASFTSDLDGGRMLFCSTVPCCSQSYHTYQWYLLGG